MVRNILIAAVLCVAAPLAQSALAASASPSATDGQHAFDWEIGTWATHVRVLRNPLSGKPPEWAEYQGTSIVKPLMDGRWNFVELSVAGSAVFVSSVPLADPLTSTWEPRVAIEAGE